MKDEGIILALYDIGAIQFGEFQLKSGQTSAIYLNLRKIISYPNLLKRIALAMHGLLSDAAFDLICGVPYTALPIATCLSLEFQYPMVMRRKEKKDYGTKQVIEGNFKAGQTCLIIEDVITSGMSVIETANDLEGEGLVIQDIVALIDRQQGGRVTLEKKYRLHTVFTLNEILQHLLQANVLNNREKTKIETFLLQRSA